MKYIYNFSYFIRCRPLVEYPITRTLRVRRRGLSRGVGGPRHVLSERAGCTLHLIQPVSPRPDHHLRPSAPNKTKPPSNPQKEPTLPFFFPFLFSCSSSHLFTRTKALCRPLAYRELPLPAPTIKTSRARAVISRSHTLSRHHALSSASHPAPAV